MCSPDTVRMDMQMFTKALKEERTKQVGDIVYRASNERIAAGVVGCIRANSNRGKKRPQRESSSGNNSVTPSHGRPQRERRPTLAMQAYLQCVNAH